MPNPTPRAVRQLSKCFACDARMTGNNDFLAHTEDGQNVFVGESCYMKLAIVQGWQPPKGGPILFPGHLKTCGCDYCAALEGPK